jgi:cell division protein FtsZ
MNGMTQSENATPPPPKPVLNIKVLGIGSAGLNLLGELVRAGFAPEALIGVHSDTAALASCPASGKIPVEPRSLRPLRADADPERNRAAVEAPILRLKSLCADTDVVLLVAGLGGIAGTSLSPVLASAAREAGAFVLCCAILPFELEGSLRAEVAQAGLKRLLEAADLVICLPNQKMASLNDEATSLLDTYQEPNRLLTDCLLGLWRALASHCVIGLPFRDLCGRIREHSTACSFALAEASGPTRAAQAVERVLAHPLLGGAATLQQAAATAVCILGGPTLARAQVNRIMEQLQRQCDTASVLMGAAIMPALGDTLLVGLLVPQNDSTADASDSDHDRAAEPAPRGRGEELRDQLVNRVEPTRRHSRFVPPPPTVPPERMAQLIKDHARTSGRIRKPSAKMRQGNLPLEIVSKGRFDKSEPTIHKGEDLDVPTYIRRGVALN